MALFPVVMIVATLLVTLVAGFLFAFAVVVMPGISRLDDGGFIRAFQVMDGIIQNNSPLFGLLWMGSILALIATLILGLSNLEGSPRILLVLATILYLFAVQAPTIAINIPLNNRIQTVDVAASSDTELKQFRTDFEAKWNRWNVMRTVVAIGVSVLLIVVVLQL
ncbi:DUF1772 domain-containing protein [bacterium]|nr:DUF1772 domain-containing protein [bacterium]